MRWRLLLSPPLDGAANMALDEALMARARRTGESVLRVYSWSRPALSLGRNQRAAGVYDDAVLARRGISVVRRPTGGRALLHHREITYSVTAPVTDGHNLRATYAQVNAHLLNALERLGVPATHAQPAARAIRPGSLPCFAEPALGEIVIGNRKLVGSAQWRDAGALLQHGSIIVDDDQSIIASLMRDAGASATVPPTATLREALGRVPAAAELFDALVASVRTEDPSADMLGVDPALDADASAAASRYLDDRWTWRR